MAKILPTKKVTYFGRRAEVKEIRVAGAHGQREVRIHWIDEADARNGGHPAGTITSRTLVGNALKGTLKVLVAEHVVADF